MSAGPNEWQLADPTVALLVATAVGFVEAGIPAGALGRLRDFASGNVELLQHAGVLAGVWPYVSPAARSAALCLLTDAAGD